VNPGIDLPEVFAAQIIFWALLPVVLFAPPRWAVVAWLVMGNLDGTGPTSEASASVGWINAAKAVLLPLYLWWRLRSVPSELGNTIPARLWVALTAYAGIAALWAPFPLAAFKLIGNMVGILLAMVVLEKSSRKAFLNGGTFLILILSSLALGVVQTYYYGGVIYGFDGVEQPSRFSSFIAAQQYAAFLVAFLAIVLWHRDFKSLTRIGIGAVLGAALLLNGSRAWFLGAVLVLSVYCWLRFRHVLVIVAFGCASIAVLIALALNLSGRGELPILNTSSRVVATVSALATGTDTAQRVGLRDLTFRIAIYQAVLDELRAGDVTDILFGHGTSSGGMAALRTFPAQYRVDTLDPNRTIHNEWLRALYEWGVIGLGLLTSVFVALFYGLMRRYRQDSWKFGVSVVLSFLPAFLAAFSTENVLAGAGNAVTMSLAIMIALLWTPSNQPLNAKSAQANLV
jgi:hypothetical protein